MSRHEIAARDPRHNVIVGWDNPLQTFFFQVYDREAQASNSALDDQLQSMDPESDPFRYTRLCGQYRDDNVAWGGTFKGDIAEVSELVRRVDRWAEIGGPIIETLKQERATSPGPSPLQAQMVNLAEEIRKRALREATQDDDETGRK